MVFSAIRRNRIIDFDSTLTALDQPVKFGDTKEGFFAIRLADKLAEKGGTGTMTNAEGAQKMKNVWGKPSPWVDYSGMLDGEAVGIAIFDGKQNPKHPTTWHSRDYGLFAANPFGDHDFYNDKSKDGSMTLQPGKSFASAIVSSFIPAIPRREDRRSVQSLEAVESMYGCRACYPTRF